MGRVRYVVFLAAVCVLASACGFIDESLNGSGERTERDESSGAASSIEEAKKATIYIEAKGGLYDVGREYGELSYGSGSGFIIDPEGIAVTNNHVVTGASNLDVYVEGREEPLGAQVLGVSECSDLAVIDIEEDGYKPHLEWRDGPIESSLHVNALGYPADDVEAGEKPDQTFSEGVINSTSARGEVPWASVDSVLEHAAQIRPGNSGGPLVDDKGKVVGINFASGGAQNAQQYLAISRDEARDLIQQLRKDNVDYIGINGEADQDLGGIVVASVETGSPAFNIGIRGVEINDETGTLEQVDVIKEIEGSKLGEENTKAGYCEILRENPDDPLAVTVERYAFDENENPESLTVLEGVLRAEDGGELEEVESSVADQYGDGGDTGGSSDAGYTTVRDDTGTLTIDVPSGWNDTITGAWEEEGEEIGVQVSASPDVQSYNDSWETPGVFFGASRQLAQQNPDDTANRVLDQFQYDADCEYDGREEYDDGLYRGYFDTWADCGGTGTVFQTIAALPESGDYVVLVQTAVTSEADLDAQQKIIETFEVVGELP